MLCSSVRRPRGSFRSFIIHWPVTSDRPAIPPVTVRTRSWYRLDVDLFRSRLASSDLCLPSSWQADVDASASLYNDVITGILGEILPARLVVRRPRPSDPWFDADCRAAKRLTRRLERASRAASRRAADVVDGPAAAASASAAAETAIEYGGSRSVVPTCNSGDTRSLCYFGRMNLRLLLDRETVVNSGSIARPCWPCLRLRKRG